MKVATIPHFGIFLKNFFLTLAKVRLTLFLAFSAPWCMKYQATGCSYLMITVSGMETLLTRKLIFDGVTVAEYWGFPP